MATGFGNPGGDQERRVSETPGKGIGIGVAFIRDHAVVSAESNRMGSPRPGDLIQGVIAGTGLPLRNTSSRCFGNWTYDYSDIAQEVWDKIKPILRDRITSLYERGVIRYGSW